VNDEIRVPEVRLIGAEGEQLGVVATREALKNSEEAGLDLVEVSPEAKPPVCRIMDYGKFKFQTSKRKAAARKKQKQIQIKEIKLRPATEEADYQVKLRNIMKFLAQGDKAKITIRFRGREMSHPELGMQLLHRMVSELSEEAVVEQHPKFEGRQIVMVLGPKKK
jgi:translation initiation factor IF-3